MPARRYGRAAWLVSLSANAARCDRKRSISEASGRLDPTNARTRAGASDGTVDDGPGNVTGGPVRIVAMLGNLGDRRQQLDSFAAESVSPQCILEPMRVQGLCLIVAFSALVAGCARTPAVTREAARPHPSPLPQHTSTPKPAEPLAPGPATAVPAAPTSAPTGPAIYFVSAEPKVARAGDTIVWKVRTSADITSANASAFGVTIPLQRRAAGNFRTTFQIPAGMPAFFRRTYTIAITARNAAGNTATAHVSLRLE